MPGNFSFIIPDKLAGCARPGNYGDLQSDLSRLAGRGIGAVVSLTESDLDAGAVRDAGLLHVHIPIPDFMPPTLDQVREFVRFVDSCLARDVAVAVHCGAGMGRTGTMLACYLVRTGMTPIEAIRRVRRDRPGSIETGEQEASVSAYHRSLKGKSRRRK